VRILRAIDAALHLSGLPRCLRATFAEIARYVPQAQPFATVFAHKDKIAARVGASERTVFRHLALLEQAGVIERLEQERKSRNGRYSVARVKLTEQGAAVLGLIHSPPHDTLADRHTLTEPTVSENQPPAARATVPGDLACLSAKGVSRAGIFSLMGKATAKGKRLSDIVLSSGEHLRELTGGRLYSYLAKLATGPSCFAVAAANERKRQADERAARVMAQKAARFRQRFAGCALTDRAQKILHVIDRDCRFVQTTAPGYAGTAPLNDLAPWVEGIESGRLVLATSAVEKSLVNA
jgi:DNA-binding transcriptional ArsR family regulator